MRVDTDFPGGGADEIRISGDSVEFAAPRKGCPRPMWFSLRVAGAAGRMVRFRLVNGGQCLGGDHVAVTQPVWRDARGRWRRVPRTSCRYEGGVLEFALRPDGDTVVASCYPYQLADLEAWLSRLTQPAVTTAVAGRSSGGRPVHLVEVADPAEETFPYAGRTEFTDPETGDRLTAGRAEQLGEEYRTLYLARRAELSAWCKRLGWSFTVNHTDRLASEALGRLHLALSADFGPAGAHA